jgi:hypothetical protein
MRTSSAVLVTKPLDVVLTDLKPARPARRESKHRDESIPVVRTVVRPKLIVEEYQTFRRVGAGKVRANAIWVVNSSENIYSQEHVCYGSPAARPLAAVIFIDHRLDTRHVNDSDTHGATVGFIDVCIFARLLSAIDVSPPTPYLFL